MGKQKVKPNYRRRLLRLPDLDHCKRTVLNSLGSPASRRVYEYAGGGSRLPDGGNADVRQRDSGHLAVPFSARWSDTEPTGAVSMRWN
jgi:hypothetical protein